MDDHQPQPGALAANQEQVIMHPVFGTLSQFNASELSDSGWFQLVEEFCVTNAIAAEPAPVDNVGPHSQRRALFLSCVGPRTYEHLRKKCLPNLPNTQTIT